MADIAVIGAGMGAMAAAARLAVAGHRVTVFERSSGYGGALDRFTQDGFAFDTGPGLLHLPAVYRDLFVKTGKRPLEDCVEMAQLDPGVRHVLEGGLEVTLPATSRGGTVTALDAAFGAGSGERWSDCLSRARSAWDATRRPLLEEPLRADWQTLGADPYPAVRRSGLLRRRPPTLSDMARRELGGQLAQLMEGHLVGYGVDPRTAPASAAVLPYLEQTFGSWYLRGGNRALATAVYERCRERGVTFVFGAEVAGIRVEDSRAVGLTLADGTSVTASQVLFGVDPRRLPSLLPAGTGWLRAGHLAPAPDSATSRFSLFLALRGARPRETVHRTVVHSPDTGAEFRAVHRGEPFDAPTLTVLRPDDPTTRPDEGHEAVTLTATVAPQGVSDWRDPALVERWTQILIRAALPAVADLRERLMWHHGHTPADLAEATGSVGGSVAAPALAGAGGRLLHPANSTLLAGLHLVGGWSHPGGGLAHTGMSGALVSGLIVEGEGFRGSQ
ncbi:phytoene desaturase family protein [Streptomyces sp. NPDC006879]|uniref:phytoene desaturase family protein n=1 Tax=Streptomyces sp. NPDC006879 TaxID=3364767 RepID=UPI0036CA8B83